MVFEDPVEPVPPDDGPRDLLTPREFVFVCIGALVLGAGFIVWMIKGLGGHQTARAVGDFGQSLVAVLTGVLCWLRARKDEGRARSAWVLLGASAFAWGAGQLALSYFDVLARDSASSADVGIGCIAAAPLAAAALLCLFGRNGGWASHRRLFVDGVIVAASTLLLGWVLVFAHMYGSGRGVPILDQRVGVAYPIGDIAIITLVIVLVSAQKIQGVSASLVSCALGGLALADIVFLYLNHRGEYVAGSLIDGAWVLGYLVIALAALKPNGLSDTKDPGGIASPIGVASLPYVMAGLCTAVLISRVIGGRKVDGFQLWCIAAIYMALIVRHHLVVRENHSLTSDLEEKVALRASELHHSEERLKMMIQNVSDVVSVVRRDDGKMLFTSASASDVLGYSSAELNGVSIFALVHSQDVPLMEGFLGNALHTGGRAARIEVRMRHRDGSWRHTETSGADLSEDPVLGGVVLTTRDVTEQKQLEDQLTHQAFHDSLTGLPNRALFADRLEHALARAQRTAGSLAVLFVDLDDFKSINDSFGHVAGDELLARVAQLLVAVLRPADTVARLGGDEFAILMEDAGIPEALELAGRLKSQLAQPLVVQGSEAPVASSIGIAVTGEDASNGAELMRNADIAMYSAKNDGKSRCRVFESSMHSVVLERVALQADLRHAVERDELQLHYQPVIELVTGRPLGFEALVRWHHPERGMVQPLEFICLAEESGLITPIGDWVLTEACRQLVQWDRAGITDGSFGISVNVSGRQVADSDFVATLAEILTSTQLDPRRLTIELTESTLLEDTEATIAWLSLLKELGIRLALDDFGTGFSSLSYLRRLPVDCLKVDASFVRSIAPDGSGGELAIAVVNLARTLRLRTVAEGVEHAHQVEFLTRSGCRFAQGYHYSRPLPNEQVPPFLEAFNAQMAEAADQLTRTPELVS